MLENVLEIMLLTLIVNLTELESPHNSGSIWGYFQRGLAEVGRATLNVGGAILWIGVLAWL